ncbi:TetR/AcrR family transcriptional regulator [Streptomyces sp. NPDC055105]|uniref:TetR/AcrR family transcriptional regulator n=1 Tax=Streptomyces sp. NPDC055105 TaxID=3365719 RepID=UPI0037CE4099
MTPLEKAMRAFWEHGYEATTVADLAGATDIGAPSLYAAFGDKKTLFDEVVRLYRAAHASFGERACAEEPTARAALARQLHEAAAAFTRPGLPHGCLVVHAAANCTTPGIEDALRDRRQADIAAFETRIRAGVAEGELPPDTDAAALAGCTGAVFQGMSQQARDGASRSDLESLAGLAMAAWPVAAKADTKRQQQTSPNA